MFGAPRRLFEVRGHGLEFVLEQFQRGLGCMASKPRRQGSHMRGFCMSAFHEKGTRRLCVRSDWSNRPSTQW